MGRPQSFDTPQAVTRARNTFWRNGYQATSLPDLERATGLSRSSIYHAFGSKRGLFDAAVASYLTDVVRPLLSPLTAPDVGPTALDDYLASLQRALAAAHSPTATSGCLLINTATSTAGQDAAIAGAITGYLTELRTALARGVDALDPTPEPAAAARLADTCLGLIVAALALVRVDAATAQELLVTARNTARAALPARAAADPQPATPAASRAAK